MKVKFSLIAAAAAVMFASAAQADTVTGTLANPLAGQQNVTLTVTGVNGGNPIGEVAGGFNWTGTSGTGVVGNSIAGSGTFRSYCIELTQSVSFGGAANWNVSNLENAPIPTTAFSDLSQHGKADNLRRLFTVVYGINALDPNALTGDNAAAFQLAVWDIVYDSQEGDGSVTPFSLSAGDFVATGSATTLGIANGWLAAINSSISPLAGVYALTSNNGNGTFQDQVVFVPGGGPLVPLPTAALGGLALMSGLVGRRRMGL